MLCHTGCATTVEEDEQLLLQLSALQEKGDQEGADAVSPSSVRLQAAVSYRLERKKLIQACSTLLSIYSRSR